MARSKTRRPQLDPATPRRGPRLFLGHFAIIFLPVATLLLVVGAILHAYDHHEARKNLVRFEENEVNRVTSQVGIITATFEHIIADLRFLSEAHDLLTALGDDHARREALEERLFTFAAYQGIYDQIRLLDEEGMERVRINYANGRAQVVPADRLQDKSSRYYFSEAFRLQKGQVFISRFDLNVEHGTVEAPRKPTIRFATPLFDDSGRKRGVAVLNYLGGPLLDRFRRAAASARGETMLLNAEGYWLVGPTPDDEWTFMYPNREHGSFDATFPNAWQRIAAGTSGQFYDAARLFVFATITPFAATDSVHGGSSTATPCTWKVVSIVTPQALATVTGQRSALIGWAFGALVLLHACGSFFMARFWLRRRLAETALRESERRYSLFVKSFPGIASRTGGDGRPDFFHGRVEDITGYQEGHFTDGTVRWHDIVHSEDAASYRAIVEETEAHAGRRSEVEYRIVRKDGQIRWLLESLQNVSGDVAGTKVVQRTALDITERRLTEQELQASLRDGELLLREVHHRVKNNMQVISSLLSLQRHTLDDAQSVAIFDDLHRRIMTMAMTYETLSRSSHFSNLDLGPYIEAVAKNVFSAHRAGPRAASLDLRVDSMPVDPDIAMQCGLVVSELVSNALKHAFPTGGPGTISVSLRSSPDGEVELTVADDGVGLPAGFDLGEVKSLGLTLVVQLVTRQLRGTLEVTREGVGAAFRVVFRLDAEDG